MLIERNDGSGHFTLMASLPITAQAIAVGDIDDDGDLDLFFGTNSSDFVYLNQGGNQAGTLGAFVPTGQTLAAFAEYGCDVRTTDVQLTDVDGDGKLDAVAASQGDGEVRTVVWLGDGLGHFRNQPQAYAPSVQPGLGSNTPYKILVGDFDGDEQVDVAAALSDRFEWYANQGAGQLKVGQTIGQANGLADIRPRSIATGDVDGDGDLDIVVGNHSSSGNSQVLLNNGAGVFSPGQNLGVSTVTDVELADFNGDGTLDVYFLNATQGALWIGDGTGNFTAGPVNATLASAADVAVGDLDGDGDLDLFSAATISHVLLNTDAPTLTLPPRLEHSRADDSRNPRHLSRGCGQYAVHRDARSRSRLRYAHARW